MQVQSLGLEDTLEEKTATHSSILASRIPRTEEPGRPRPMGAHKVGHDRSDSALAKHMESALTCEMH